MSDEGVTCDLDTELYRPFPLLLLPVEIQLQIYRFAWMAGPVEEQPSTVCAGDFAADNRRLQKNGSIQLEMIKRLKEQLSTVRTMGTVCRHMRDAVYEEYFSRTQAVLQSNIFFDYTLRWLMSLRKLKTLEVVFEQSKDPASRRDSFWIKGHPGLESAKLGIQSLPRLEKLVFRLKWGHEYPQEEAISWEEFPWFQELRQVFLENAAVSEDAKQRCFKFKNHIGVTYPDWPCSYEI
ncbi:hypothetical protein N0V85_007659 [Neurospora sp. IMI 360204]|nr:hypothetical protein N0V85_007659 [Neurospora sp. IMI 360204]